LIYSLGLEKHEDTYSWCNLFNFDQFQSLIVSFYVPVILKVFGECWYLNVYKGSDSFS